MCLYRRTKLRLPIFYPLAGASRGQLNYCDGGSASVSCFRVNLSDERMRAQKFSEAAAKSSRAVTMDYADARLIVECGGVDELVYARAGFLDGAADHIYFFDGWLIGGLRYYADSAARCRYRMRGFRRGALDTENIFERDFHSHRASFHFG